MDATWISRKLEHLYEMYTSSCTGLLNMCLNIRDQIHTWYCLYTLLVNMEAWRRCVSTNISIAYFHIHQYPLLFSCE